MRTAWARGAASAGSLLALLGLGSCALVFNYGDYKDAEGGGTDSGGTGSGGTGSGGTSGSATGGGGTGGGTGSAGGTTEPSGPPVMPWSKRFGDDAEQTLGGLSLDAEGNVLLAGTFLGAITLDGRMIENSMPTTAAFGAELGPGGEAHALGAISEPALPFVGLGVAKDSQKHILVAGHESYDKIGLQYGYIMPVDGPKTLTRLLVNPATSKGTASVLDVVVDSSDNVYAIARFTGTIKFCNRELTSHGGEDILVVKYAPRVDDPSGNCLWTMHLGSPLDDVPWGIAVSPKGQVFVTGEYRGQLDDLPVPPTGGNNMPDSAIFVMKVEADGSPGWKKGFPSMTPTMINENARGTAIAIDGAGNPWVTGAVLGLVITENSVIQLQSAGASDVFVMQLNRDDGKPLFGKCFGDMERQEGTGIAVAPDGSIFVTGTFSGKINFAGPPNNDLSSVGSQSIFLAKLDGMGEHVRSDSYGIGITDELHDVRVAAGKRAVVIAGSWKGDLTFDQVVPPKGGGLDVFVAGFAP